MFDDTYEHEVWNDTRGTRVVLFLDVVRPLRFPRELLNWLVLQVIAHSPYVQDGADNYRKWEKKLDQAGSARETEGTGVRARCRWRCWRHWRAPAAAGEPLLRPASCG